MCESLPVSFQDQTVDPFPLDQVVSGKARTGPIRTGPSDQRRAADTKLLNGKPLLFSSVKILTSSKPPLCSVTASQQGYAVLAWYNIVTTTPSCAKMKVCAHPIITPGFEVLDYVFRRDDLCFEVLRAASRVCWARFTEFGPALCCVPLVRERRA